MITTEIINNKKYANLYDLKEWEKNPRHIEPEDYQRLLKDLSLGIFAPLFVMDDGTVVGGNMRVKGYREKKFEKVWVCILSFKQENNLFYAYIDDERVEANGQARGFKSIDEGLFIYAMAHNDKAGTDDKVAYKDLIEKLAIDVSEMYVNFAKPTPLSMLLASTEQAAAEIKWALELMEYHDYVVFVFDNELDFNILKQRFPLRTVKTKYQFKNGIRKGIGHIIHGKELLKELK